MKSLVSKIGKAAVILGVSGLVTPLSVRAGGPAFHSGSSASASSIHASHPVQTSPSHAYVHPSPSGTSTAKSVTSTSSTSSIRFTHNGTSNASGGSTTPKTSKINNPSSSQTTIMSSNGTIGSTTVGGNLVFKRNEKNPTGASATLPAGGGHTLGTTTPASKNVMDYGAYSTGNGNLIPTIIDYLFSPIIGPSDPFEGTGGTSPTPGNGQNGGNDPNHLGNGADGNYGDGMAMPEPTKQPSKLWSGSSNLASSANVNAKGTAPKASISLANGEQVQKHLDQVATANSPAGKIQKGQQIQKQLGNAASNSNPSGPAAKMKKGEQIQKQISAGAANSTPSTPNPPSPPPPSTTTNTTSTVPVPFPLWSGLGWGYFGGGSSGASGYDLSGTDAGDVTTPTTDNAKADPSQPADGELTLKLGESYTIANENFGTQTGNLSLQLNGLTLAVHVNQWDAEQISFTLPTAGLTKATEGKFQIQGADRQLVKAVAVTVVSADTVR